MSAARLCCTNPTQRSAYFGLIAKTCGPVPQEQPESTIRADRGRPQQSQRDRASRPNGTGPRRRGIRRGWPRAGDRPSPHHRSRARVQRSGTKPIDFFRFGNGCAIRGELSRCLSDPNAQREPARIQTPAPQPRSSRVRTDRLDVPNFGDFVSVVRLLTIPPARRGSWTSRGRSVLGHMLLSLPRFAAALIKIAGESAPCSSRRSCHRFADKDRRTERWWNRMSDK